MSDTRASVIDLFLIYQHFVCLARYRHDSPSLRDIDTILLLCVNVLC